MRTETVGAVNNITTKIFAEAERAELLIPTTIKYYDSMILYSGYFFQEEKRMQCKTEEARNSKEDGVITPSMLEQYEKSLYREEKAPNTIQKYVRDLKKLVEYANGRRITKELMISYREYLLEEKKYRVSSVNSYIVAANRFFAYMEWYGRSVKTLKVQPAVYCPEQRELTGAEYRRLVRTARAEHKERLAMILIAICATGMRVGELSAITRRGVQKGEVIVRSKGKLRKVLLPEKLQRQLLIYAAQNKITTGPLFQTRSGRPVSRTNIWRDMKKLCEKANVSRDKTFPHNLRHLFARTYFQARKDIAKLADLLGHSSIETTRIYLRCSAGKCRKELDALGLVV